MKLLSRRTLAAIPLLALVACDGGTPASESPADETPTAAPAPPGGTATPGTAPAARPTAIPAAIQGRWGLVAADCEPGRPDAKGLLVIDGTTLEFYESVGTLSTVAEGGPASIRASFDFMGEGMEWQRDVALSVEDNGRILVRREFGSEAAPEPFRYARCS